MKCQRTIPRIYNSLQQRTIPATSQSTLNIGLSIGKIGISIILVEGSERILKQNSADYCCTSGLNDPMGVSPPPLTFME